MFGGDLPELDAFTLSLLTNAEVLAVNQNSRGNRPLLDHDQLVVWIADVPGSADKYLAVFNTSDEHAVRERPDASNRRASIKSSDIGNSPSYAVRDLWDRKTAGQFTDEFAPTIPSHGARLYRLTPLAQ
jgi:alpha-galactosidase